MERFWNALIGPLLGELRPNVILCLGDGGLTRRLLEHCLEHGGQVHVVGEPDTDRFDALPAELRRPELLRVHDEEAADVLERLGLCDVVVADGGAEARALRHDLERIERAVRDFGNPFPVVLVHGAVSCPADAADTLTPPSPLARFGRERAETLVLLAFPFLGGLEVLAPRETIARSAELSSLEREASGPLLQRGLVTALARDREQALVELDAVRRALHQEIEARRAQARELARREDGSDSAAAAMAAQASRNDGRVAQLEQELRIVTDLIAALRGALDELLATGRWRWGDKLARLVNRMRRRPLETPAPLARLETLFAHAPKPPPESSAPQAGAADVVICVHDALDDVRRCLESVVLFTPERVRLILVDDGSGPETREFLARFAESTPGCTLLRSERATGYTAAANRGLRACDAEWVVLLNSDTIVSRGWLARLLECATSSPRIGIVGPLSNAASWQSIPERFDANGDWAVNPLPEGLTIGDVAELVNRVSLRRFPRVDFVNGFCLAVHRPVLDAIGLLDERAFPDGYGEENDFCLRAAAAGFELAIADQTYVWHAKSKSYSHERRRRLARAGRKVLERKHGPEPIANGVERLRDEPALEAVRVRVGKALAELRSWPRSEHGLRVLFVLPVRGGSGGAHSVVQEAGAMRTLGVDARIAVQRPHLASYRALYPSRTDAAELFLAYGSREELAAAAWSVDVVVATIFFSLDDVEAIVQANPRVLPAYYVQDYEPLFVERDSKRYREAYESYTRIEGALLFAKTRWLCDIVQRKHGVRVRKVAPSLDLTVYHPPFAPRPTEGPVRMTAMLRPSTPRRAPQRTVEVLGRVFRALGDKVEVDVFGATDDQLRDAGIARTFPFRNHGILLREEVAHLLRGTDIFVDLSDYQAFGRTALEAMACGACSVVPAEGGADEYAEHEVNALVVDTRSVDECAAAVERLARDADLRGRLARAGLERATTYSVQRAAISEIAVFVEALGERGPRAPAAASRRRGALGRSSVVRVLGVLARGPDHFVGSAHIRLLRPLAHPALAAHLRFEPVEVHDVERRGADVVVVQRNAIRQRDDVLRLLDVCRRSGTRLVLEIDDDLFDLPETHRESGRYRASLEGARTLALHADRITVTTRLLAERMRRFNGDVVTIPNALDIDLWLPGGTRDVEPTPRVLYMGTPSHKDDLELVRGAVEKARARLGRLELDVVGVSGDRAQSWYRRVDAPRDLDYPGFVGWLRSRNQWGIGIAPLVATDFNRAKSHLKYLDYAALGLAVACSRLEPYEEVVRDGENGLLLDDPGQWADALERLVRDPAERTRLAAAARRTLFDGHTLSECWKFWLAALTDFPSSAEPTAREPEATPAVPD